MGAVHSDEWHSAILIAGAYRWDATPDTMAGDGDLVRLQVSQGRETDAPIHGWPEPAVCSFTVLIDSVSTDVPTLKTGDLVHAQLWRYAPGSEWPAPFPSIAYGMSPYPPLILFYGRVTDLEQTPGPAGKQLLTVTATDRTVDLANQEVGQGAWPAESTGYRLNRIAAEAGWPEFTFTTGPGPAYSEFDPETVYWGKLSARPAGQPADALSLLKMTIEDTFGDLPNYDGLQGELQLAGDPNDLTRLHPVTPLRITAGPTRYHAGWADGPDWLAGILVRGVDGKARVDASHVTRRAGAWLSMLIDSAKAAAGRAWTKTGTAPVDNVQITNGDLAIKLRIAGTSAFGRTGYSRDSQLNTTDQLFYNANAYLPGRGYEAGWTLAGEVDLLDPDPLVPLIWLGQNYRDGYGIGGNELDGPWSHMPFVIRGLDPAENPNGSTIYAGTVVGATCELTRPGWRYSVQLRPNVPKPYSLGGTGGAAYKFNAPTVKMEPWLSCHWLNGSPALAGLTLADLDPSVSCYDLRVVRRPDDVVVNLLQNPSFTIDATGWSVTAAGGSLARTTAQAKDVPGSLALTGGAAGVTAFQTGEIPVDDAGDRFRVAGWVRSATNSRQVKLQLTWHHYTIGTGYAPLAAPVDVAVGNTTTTGWTYLEGIVTVPAFAQSVDGMTFTVAIPTSASGGVHYVDQLLLTRELTPGRYPPP